MTAIARTSDTTTTATAIAEAIAKPIHFLLFSTAELTDLQTPNWQLEVAMQLREALQLTEGWDGFRAGPIRRDVLAYACQVLDRIMQQGTPAPHVTPMSHEGLMLEWHERGVDLEIEIEVPGHLWMSFEDRVEDIDDEYHLESDLTRLTIPVDKVTKRAMLQA